MNDETVTRYNIYQSIIRKQTSSFQIQKNPSNYTSQGIQFGTIDMTIIVTAVTLFATLAYCHLKLKKNIYIFSFVTFFLKTKTETFENQKVYIHHHQPILYLKHNRLSFVRTMIACHFSKPPSAIVFQNHCWTSFVEKVERLLNFFYKIGFVTKLDFFATFIRAVKVDFYFLNIDTLECQTFNFVLLILRNVFFNK